MAAEVPVTDVLCEAMEYLTKLGSNLRTRSEKLKVNRICKEKLQNAHAVQKAANKVLLICELSKKSLENVESGIRKVLSHIDASQATKDGGKFLNSSKDESRKSEFRYFTYQSRKLKISKSKRVPLKHFMSAKVFAKNLPVSMQDKYPVYYDCKLYRMRKRKHALEKQKTDETLKNVSLEDENLENNSLMDNTRCQDGNSDTECKIENKQSKSKYLESTTDHTDFNVDDSNSSNDRVRKKSHSQKTLEESKNINTDQEQSKEETKKREIGGDVVLEIKHSNNSAKDNKSGDSDNDSQKDNSSKAQNVKKCQKRKFNKFKFIDDSSNSSKELKLEEASVQNKKNIVIDNNVSDSESSITKDHKPKKRKIIDSDSETENMKHEPVISTDEKEQRNDQSQETESDHKKPMIKCVNISKLLKPDVLQNSAGDNSSQTNKSGTKSSSKSTRQQPCKDSKIKDYLIKESKIKYEQEYWEKKRKEVTAFIPKNFVINITRLPKLSENFLQTHNLKVITQNGSILYRVSNETDNNMSNLIIDHIKNNSKSNIDKAKQSEDVNKVKNALLNDSDSDDKVFNSELSAEAEKVKNALLNDSDSDKNDRSDLDGNETLQANLKIQHNNGPEKKTNNTEKVKDTLLKDSDSDNRNKVSDSIQKKNLESKESNIENLDNILQLKPDLQPSNNDPIENSERQENLPISVDSGSADSKNLSEEYESTLKIEINIDNDDKTNNTSSKNENETEKTVSDKEVTPTKSKRDKSSESSDDIPKTPLSQRKKRKQSLTPQSKRKRIMESMHAKKMLLTYSSSSDTEDEQLKKALKEIKKSLLKGVSSDEENGVDKKLMQRRRVSSSTSSSSDIIRKVKNKDRLTPNSSDSEKQKKEKEESSQDIASNDEKLKRKDSTEQMDGNMDEQSNSSSSKMVRSKAKPGNCSSQNSDNQDTSDKDIDGLTNLNKLNASHRRRVSTSSDTTANSNSRKKTSNATKTSLIGEELLQSESSGAASLAGSDGELEELPPVSIQKLNGSGLEHLGKDELLGESDSSISHNEKDKSSEEYQKEEETDEESVKLKRRKANAISSDSEAGSSRKKLERVSDFEDSEDEGSENIKKRKKKVSDSDASAGSSSNDGSKKKRRRIKQVNEDSDGSGSDSENEGRNKHGRKNIRKVMGKNQLEEATKKAAREEKERIARITERQKLYNNLEFDESGKPDEVVLEKVVLDFDPETKDPLIEVDRGLVKKLKPHQANGIKFMWDACFESVKRIKKDKGSGCILAHCMGLGKTLQVVSLTHTLLIHSALTNVNRVLVVCPLSTVLNWVNEFRMWLKHSESDYEVDVYELSRYKQNSERAYQLQCWLSGGGVCVLGYEMFRNLSADNNKKYKKKMLRNFQESLVDPGPDLVVCDEGHLLKNEKTSLSQSMNRVKTRRRIVLTGTPLQNNLKEYYCMVQFVKPNLLGKYNEYLNRFVNPITNGQYTDSTEHDIRIMKRRSHVLHKMLDGAVQRRDYGVLAPFLPPKHEYVLFITLAEVQTKLYQFYLDNYSRRPLPGRGSGFLFPDFQSLQRIWTHPLVLKYNSERYEIMQQKKREREEEDSEGSLVDFIDDDDSTPDESSTESSSDDLSDASDDSRKKSQKKKSAKKGKNKDPKFTVKRGTRANPVEMDEDVKEADEVVEVKNENPTEWWIKLVTDDEIDDMRNSHKLVLLFDILRQCEAIGDKLLVFSQSLYSLDLIEHFLGKVDEATQEGRIDEKLGGHVGSWSPGVDYFRLDGSTSCENRSIWCKNFNREDNPRARLFLISTRAGGLGINLVAANRVVIFDVSWNPSHDVQSIFRVYRFGQKKPCYVYRFLAMGTMEEKIYERQVTKQAISKRVIDEQQIDRHYAENDLAELYTFEPTPPQPRPLPPLPKDRLFAEMLREHEAQIYKYHEHDSLLENKEEETLSEEERKAAWEDFENEKNKPPPAPFPSPWPMHNGMVPGLLQQQQLAYATLAAMLRKDMPGMNENQIRDMLPLIYNSNPGLMQKMNEIYKYTQQQSSMMNPGMMNSVMNPSSAGGVGVGVGAGGMGGSSALQYEPPWQRQHQQQQQIRLQQLMQQQNQMGAKFYSGGLGSRDPVAMALQQQRAREIMLGGGGGGAGGAGAAAPVSGASRPRGRPPLQPRAPAPPPNSSDVVNLDSD